MKFVIITGLSGAGKTTALKALENMGFFCVDNLPGILLTKFADLCFQGNTEFTKVAVCIDVRGVEFFKQLNEAFDYMDASGYSVDVVFLYCNKEILVNRYNFTRHVHPLAQEGSILKSIQKEERLLEPIKKRATYLLDTSNMQAKNIRYALERLYNDGKMESPAIYISSFGFKRGIPVDADYVFDVRFLPNPYNVQELRPHNGTEQCVLDYLKSSDDFNKTVDMLFEEIKFLIPRYGSSGKHEMSFAIGCTGGFHRSVAIAELLKNRLNENGYDCECIHRDLSVEGK